jgi:hypothetical protein
MDNVSLICLLHSVGVTARFTEEIPSYSLMSTLVDDLILLLNGSACELTLNSDTALSSCIYKATCLSGVARLRVHTEVVLPMLLGKALLEPGHSRCGV